MGLPVPFSSSSFLPFLLSRQPSSPLGVDCSKSLGGSDGFGRSGRSASVVWVGLSRFLLTTASWYPLTQNTCLRYLVKSLQL